MLKFSKEQFATVMGELPELLAWHHLEIEGDNPEYPLELDWTGYLNLERAGMFHLATARKGGKLVGYGFIRVGKEMFSRRITYGFVNPYILPEHRDPWDSIRFFRFIDKIMVELGVEDAHLGTHPSKNISSLYKRLGYTLNEMVYSKRLRK